MFGKDMTWREELVFGESFGMKKDMSPTKQTNQKPKSEPTKKNQPKTKPNNQKQKKTHPLNQPDNSMK